MTPGVLEILYEQAEEAMRGKVSSLNDSDLLDLFELASRTGLDKDFWKFKTIQQEVLLRMRRV